MEELAVFDPKAEVVPQLEVVKVSDGLGFGEGGISRQAIEDQPGNEDLSELTDAAIHSPNILVPVSKDEHGQPIKDDGCGDGRNIMRIFSKVRNFAKSLFRPKVFGGGATMATAMRIGLGEADGKPLQTVFHEAITQLNNNGIDFGAHTDNKAHGKNCGCGAIDKAPLIVAAAAGYRQEIRGAIMALGVPTEGLDEVATAYAVYAGTISNQNYSGRQVMDQIIDNRKIIKELADEHKETRIILNLVKGCTVNQEYARQQTGGRAHVFAVDVWRLQELADKSRPGTATKQKAFLAELVYTLATAAVLTKGDLPVYVVQAT